MNTLKWTNKTALQALAISLFLYVVVQLIAMICSSYEITRALVDTSTTIGLITTYILTITVLLTPLAYVATKSKANLEDLSLKKIPLTTLVASLVKGYALFIACILVLSLIQNMLPYDIPGLSSQQNLPFVENSGLTKHIGYIIAVILAPIIEEFFYRGFILKTLLSNMNVYFASIITALFFSLSHMQFESFVGITILSLIINYIYIRGNHSIIPTIIFHMVNNAVALTILSNL